MHVFIPICLKTHSSTSTTHSFHHVLNLPPAFLPLGYLLLCFLTQDYLSSSCITLLLKDPSVGKQLEPLQHSELHLSFQLLLRNFFSLKYFQLKIFIYLDVVDLHCVMWDFFCFGAQTLVVVCRLSFPKACRILVPRPGIEPTSSGLQSRLLTTKSWEVPNFPFFTTPCLFW